jgi:predicted PurR-regulated permease PerM
MFARKVREAAPEESATAEIKVVEESAEEDRPLITDLADLIRHAQAVVPTAVIGIFLMGLVAFMYFARPFLMPLILAVLLTFLLKPVVGWLERIRVPAAVGAAIVMVFFFTVLWVTFANFVQPAAKEWQARAPESLHQLESKIQKWIRPFRRAAEQVENITKGPTSGEPTAKVEVSNTTLQVTLFSYTKSFVTEAIETIVLLYFLLAAGDLFMQKMVKILPSLQDKKKAVAIADEVQRNISRFLFTITVINICVGILVGSAVAYLGVPNPALWGVVAGLLNFIPYFGPIVGVTTLAIIGLLTFEHVSEAVLPPLIYLLLHNLESNFLTPMILGRRLTLNPVVIFISLMFWTWMWGIPGALLSVPVLMIVKIFCDHFKPLAPIGEFLSG